MARQEEFPAASHARTVMTLVPVSSGTLMDQLPVPEAIPDAPPEVPHFISLTATLSLAVPVTKIEALEVEVMLTPGLTIVIEGGVTSDRKSTRLNSSHGYTW